MTRENIQRVRIYISEHDQWEEKALSIAVLERLQKEGAMGATALRGQTGFGAAQRLRTTGFQLSDHSPIIIEWIDQAERISHILPLLGDMLPGVLITREDVEIYQAGPRAQGLFTVERSVGDMMLADAHVLQQSATLAEALAVMLRHDQRTLPILNAQGFVQGVITEEEITIRAGLRLPLRLLRLLNADEMAQVNEQLAQRTVAEVMTSDPHSVYAGASLPQALITMIEWRYEQVPVTNREGAFAGLLDGNALLHAVLEQSSAEEDSGTRTPVQLIMQSAVPRIAVTQPLQIALRHLLASANRYLVVIDEAGQVQGILNDTTVLQHFDGQERLLWLAALQSQTPVDKATLPGDGRSLREVLQHSVPTLSPTTSIIDSVRLLLEHDAERLPVVDEDSKLLGILARSGLLRALMQESQ
jgi:hypothetical protein